MTIKNLWIGCMSIMCIKTSYTDKNLKYDKLEPKKLDTIVFKLQTDSPFILPNNHLYIA